MTTAAPSIRKRRPATSKALDFSAVDTIVLKCIEKYGRRDDLDLAIRISDTGDEYNYVHRAIAVSAMLAYRSAEEWKVSRKSIAKTLCKKADDIELFLKLSQSLSTAVLNEQEEWLAPYKIADPAVWNKQSQAAVKVEAVKYLMEFVELDKEQLLEFAQELRDRAKRRDDVLTREFTTGMRDIWRILTGAFPASSDEGLFVAFCEEGWKLAGFNRSNRSLGKPIKKLAMAEHWSLLRRLKIGNSRD